jgi:group I intron endonuclease
MMGIYLIQHKSSGKIYIGKSVNPARRWKEHCRKREQHIDKAIAAHGKDAFTFSVIETWNSEAELETAERFLIAYYRGLGAELYNRTSGGEGCVGYRHTPETLAMLKLQRSTEEYKEMMRQHKRGTKHSEETKMLISEKANNQFSDPAQRERVRQQMIGNTIHLGHTHTEEAKIRVGNASRARIITDETREKNRLAALRGWEIRRAKKAA